MTIRKIYYRWSDHDRRCGPFIYARNRSGASMAVQLASSGGDERPFSTLRLQALGHTLIALLPPVVKPWRRWVDTSGYQWSSGRGGYWDIGQREYGFSVSNGYLSVSLGRVTHDSSTEQRWGYFFPWTEWRHVRHTLYDLNGEKFADLPEWGFRHKNGWAVKNAIEDACPVARFEFDDFDGERIIATTKIEERQWKRGVRAFRWLSLIWPDQVRRSLDIKFSAETGKRKGSWKGGTIGHSIDMLPGELHEAAFRRYCAEHAMTFAASVAPA